ncbi:unnamed protein product, partial [Heterosigma akashiwo]
PIQVTVFDVDYVISRDEIIALLDKCPHKLASLSEGRVSACGKLFQCAYHGWSFDGTTGQCVEIPQVVASEGLKSSGLEPSERSSTTKNRADTTAVPAMIQQGMVWL